MEALKCKKTLRKTDPFAVKTGEAENEIYNNSTFQIVK